ncbi:sensor histidine kinase [Roseofilum casamattae]|uniref:histidine kinase n=1 Tax=Roseofilum casamattae BLCC-M143 TaxID=3022442 RepID=A0ABT7C2U1_9CYAN|nr:ATP-binding protein [Roseofilum casamattae]MDJ1184853.1 cache domain-containing protein [Roseofilum casamattae BLCC-M143]
MTVLIVLGVLPVVFTALRLEQFHTATILQNDAGKILAVKAERLADNITQWDRIDTLMLQNLSQQPGLAQMTPQELYPLLQSTHQTYGNSIRSIGIADLEGNFIASSETELSKSANVSDRRWFQSALSGQPITREVIPSEISEELLLVIAVPIVDRKDNIPKLRGVLRAIVDFQEIDAAVAKAHAGDTKYTLLVDETGKLLASDHKHYHSFAHEPLELEPLKDFSTYTPVRSLLEGNDGLLEFTDDRGIAWLARVASLPNGWGIVLMQEEQDIIAQERSHRRSAFLLGMSSLTIVGIITWYFSHWVTQPLTDLTEAVFKLSNGQWKQRVEIAHNDELGSLAYAFNSMARQLEQSFTELATAKEDLEVRVDERTQELHHTLQQLQQAQAQMVQHEKMSSLGQMVAGLAHEINNPVSFIHGNLSHAQTYMEDLLAIVELYQAYYPHPPEEIQNELDAIDMEFIIEDFAKMLQSMNLGTMRIREIVKSLRTFARLDEADFKSVDVREGIESTLMILQGRLNCCDSQQPINIVTCYGELPEIACYPGQLNQVLMNLIANAIDTLEERNHQFSPEQLQAEPSTIWITTEMGDRDWISIRIRDNGLGIPEHLQSRLFDPFFTTKPIGQGTGLGLSISYQVITQTHKGRLSFVSTPGKGTEFAIAIPIEQ